MENLILFYEEFKNVLKQIKSRDAKILIGDLTVKDAQGEVENYRKP